MAIEPEDPHSEVEEEQEGGPVKPFLDHLEDLRWALIKSLSAVAVAMVLCLVAGDRVVAILKRPLDHATVKYPSTVQVITFLLGTNRLGTVQLPLDEQKKFGFGSNQFVHVQVEPVMIESNVVFRLAMDTNAAPVTSQKLDVSITTFGPASSFFLAVQVAIYAGIGLASPFILYFIGQFVFPALKLKEKKYVYRGLFFGGGLFATGVSFCYFVLMPVALVASVKYSEWLGFPVTQWRGEDYIGFVCKFMLGMGLGFELPVVVLTLVKIGVVDYRMLAKARRYVIIINFILGAALTTPEVITQLLMAIPLQFLYEVTVWIAWYWERKARKRAAEENLPAADTGQISSSD